MMDLGQGGAVVRVPIRGGIVRIPNPKTIVSTIVPIATTANRTNNVGIDEIGGHDSVPCYKSLNNL